ncbi:unnamed protein product [Citrullus colocynthis]|uniref:Maturase K n=1 Tax=Citrullus colocynthis TaxID=252529 RepID=A0ABP0YXD3_9ROSI
MDETSKVEFCVEIENLIYDYNKISMIDLKSHSAFYYSLLADGLAGLLRCLSRKFFPNSSLSFPPNSQIAREREREKSLSFLFDKLRHHTILPSFKQSSEPSSSDLSDRAFGFNPTYRSRFNQIYFTLLTADFVLQFLVSCYNS